MVEVNEEEEYIVIVFINTQKVSPGCFRWQFVGGLLVKCFFFMFRWHKRELLKHINICILQSNIYCKVIITRKWTNGKLWFACETGKAYCRSCFILSFYAALCFDCYCFVVSVSSILVLCIRIDQQYHPKQNKKEKTNKNKNKKEQQNKTTQLSVRWIGNPIISLETWHLILYVCLAQY